MSDRQNFRCSYNRIEIIVSYLCNLKCNNCDALVSQAPSNASMTVEQIQKFINESIENQVHWKHIRLLGGEPTLHKEIFVFLDILRNYRDNYSPKTKIQLVTNGFGSVVKTKIAKVPNDIEIENSNKSSSFQPQFAPINVAPIDTEEYKSSDFSKGCWIPSLCGITLDMHGYYPCSAAAAFDRVLGFDKGQKTFPKFGDLEKLFSVYCKFCNHFVDKINDYADFPVDSDEAVEKFEKIHKDNFAETQKDNYYKETIYSKTWEKVMKKYKEKKPILTRY